MKNRKKKYGVVKRSIIKSQADEIRRLKDKIAKLEEENKQKDDTITSVEPLSDMLQKEIDDVRGKKKEYDRLISDLKEMREVFNQEVFKGRWNIIKFLMK